MAGSRKIKRDANKLAKMAQGLSKTSPGNFMRKKKDKKTKTPHGKRAK